MSHSAQAPRLVEGVFQIHWENGLRTVHGILLGALGAHQRYKEEDGRPLDIWSITHLPTGLSLGVANCNFHNKDAAIAAMKEIAPIADWANLKRTDASLRRLRKRVAQIGIRHGGERAYGGEYVGATRAADLNGFGSVAQAEGGHMISSESTVVRSL